MVAENQVIKRPGGDLPGGPVVKNTPFNAGDAGSNPGPGTKIPRATTKTQHSLKKKKERELKVKTV